MSGDKVVEIIVSTMNDNVYKAISDFECYVADNVVVTIIHQVSNGKEYNIEAEVVRYFQYAEVGLPSSRNRGLENAVGDILLPTDDDVYFESNFTAMIVSAFDEFPNADVITFKAKTPEGEDYKSYPSRSFYHNWRSLLGVSSIEICLRKDSFGENGPRWDPDYGLGAKFPGGLEVVFLQDCRRKLLSMVYYPACIVFHPAESSGKTFTPTTMRLRGAILARAFNVIVGPILAHAFYFKKRAVLSKSGITLLLFSKETFFLVVLN